MTLRSLLTAGLACLVLVQGATAQDPHLSIGLRAIGLYSHVNLAPGGGTVDALQVVQPTLMVHAGAFDDRLRLTATGNFEGLTIPDGELSPGAWGEGFVDRRHPHTYLHELMLSADDLLGRRDGAARVSLSLGKGFAPFGTDDPMSRPIMRYPVNHHLSQILERAVGIAAVRAGPVSLETALFNGDEPDGPGAWPRLSRFGDSWSTRVTVYPVRGLEVQGSYAFVHSPEHRPGAGLDQKKWSSSARWEGHAGGQPLYLMGEWAVTQEAAGFFSYHTLLAEGAWSPGPHRLLWRLERTDRPEEPRTADPYRTVRPHLDNSVQGHTRWTVLTAGYAARVGSIAGLVRVEPQVELAYGWIASLGGAGFDPATFYGRDRFWSVSIGLKMGLGMAMHRMGRYGAVEQMPDGMAAGTHMH